MPNLGYFQSNLGVCSVEFWVRSVEFWGKFSRILSNFSRADFGVIVKFRENYWNFHKFREGCRAWMRFAKVEPSNAPPARLQAWAKGAYKAFGSHMKGICASGLSIRSSVIAPIDDSASPPPSITPTPFDSRAINFASRGASKCLRRERGVPSHRCVTVWALRSLMIGVAVRLTDCS